MLLSPIESTAILQREWIQKKPRISQKFGENPALYAPFNMKGHNGVDFAIPVGTPIFAPCDGKVKVVITPDGYGKHIKLRSSHGAREIVLGHLSEFDVKDGDTVNMGQLLGLSGNTGFSTGAHLHMGLRFLEPAQGDIFKWGVVNYNNGYYGYVDCLPNLICYKGGYETYTIL